MQRAILRALANGEQQTTMEITAAVTPKAMTEDDLTVRRPAVSRALHKLAVMGLVTKAGYARTIYRTSWTSVWEITEAAPLAPR